MKTVNFMFGCKVPYPDCFVRRKIKISISDIFPIFQGLLNSHPISKNSSKSWRGKGGKIKLKKRSILQSFLFCTGLYKKWEKKSHSVNNSHLSSLSIFFLYDVKATSISNRGDFSSPQKKRK